MPGSLSPSKVLVFARLCWSRSSPASVIITRSSSLARRCKPHTLSLRSLPRVLCPPFSFHVRLPLRAGPLLDSRTSAMCPTQSRVCVPVSPGLVQRLRDRYVRWSRPCIVHDGVPLLTRSTTSSTGLQTFLGSGRVPTRVGPRLHIPRGRQERLLLRPSWRFLAYPHYHPAKRRCVVNCLYDNRRVVRGASSNLGRRCVAQGYFPSACAASIPVTVSVDTSRGSRMAQWCTQAVYEVTISPVRKSTQRVPKSVHGEYFV